MNRDRHDRGPSVRFVVSNTTEYRDNDLRATLPRFSENTRDLRHHAHNEGGNDFGGRSKGSGGDLRHGVHHCDQYLKSKFCPDLNYGCPHFHEGLDCVKFFKFGRCDFVGGQAACRFKHRTRGGEGRDAAPRETRAIERRVEQDNKGSDGGEADIRVTVSAPRIGSQIQVPKQSGKEGEADGDLRAHNHSKDDRRAEDSGHRTRDDKRHSASSRHQKAGERNHDLRNSSEHGSDTDRKVSHKSSSKHKRDKHQESHKRHKSHSKSESRDGESRGEEHKGQREQKEQDKAPTEIARVSKQQPSQTSTTEVPRSSTPEHQESRAVEQEYDAEPPAQKSEEPVPSSQEHQGPEWQECISSTGAPYYYHLKTKETTWKPPQSFIPAHEKNHRKKDKDQHSTQSERENDQSEKDANDTKQATRARSQEQGRIDKSREGDRSKGKDEKYHKRRTSDHYERGFSRDKDRDGRERTRDEEHTTKKRSRSGSRGLGSSRSRHSNEPISDKRRHGYDERGMSGSGNRIPPVDLRQTLGRGDLRSSLSELAPDFRKRFRLSDPQYQMSNKRFKAHQQLQGSLPFSHGIPPPDLRDQVREDLRYASASNGHAGNYRMFGIPPGPTGLYPKSMYQPRGSHNFPYASPHHPHLHGLPHAGGVMPPIPLGRLPIAPPGRGPHERPRDNRELLETRERLRALRYRDVPPRDGPRDLRNDVRARDDRYYHDMGDRKHVNARRPRMSQERDDRNYLSRRESDGDRRDPRERDLRRDTRRGTEDDRHLDARDNQSVDGPAPEDNEGSPGVSKDDLCIKLGGEQTSDESGFYSVDNVLSRLNIYDSLAGPELYHMISKLKNDKLKRQSTTTTTTTNSGEDENTKNYTTEKAAREDGIQRKDNTESDQKFTDDQAYNAETGGSGLEPEDADFADGVRVLDSTMIKQGIEGLRSVSLDGFLFELDTSAIALKNIGLEKEVPEEIFSTCLDEYRERTRATGFDTFEDNEDMDDNMMNNNNEDNAMVDDPDLGNNEADAQRNSELPDDDAEFVEQPTSEILSF